MHIDRGSRIHEEIAAWHVAITEHGERAERLYRKGVITRERYDQAVWWVNKQRTPEHMVKLMDMFVQRLAVANGIPGIILLGRAPNMNEPGYHWGSLAMGQVGHEPEGQG